MDPMGIVFVFVLRLLLDDVLKPFEFQIDYRRTPHIGNSLQGIFGNKNTIWGQHFDDRFGVRIIERLHSKESWLAISQESSINWCFFGVFLNILFTPPKSLGFSQLMGQLHQLRKQKSMLFGQLGTSIGA